MTGLMLPVIDNQAFLLDPWSPEAQAACRQVSEALHEYGALVIRDERVTERDNDTFLSMMERYFDQPLDVKLQDARPEFAYQVGCTPDNTEVPKCSFDPKCQAVIESLDDAEKPHLPTGPDLKWRYFWRIGERPSETKFQELNAKPVIPKAFLEWTQVMNEWGAHLHRAVDTVSQMAAVGFGLKTDSFSSMTKNGPHLLAPTGSDVGVHAQKDTIFAGFHYDLNFLTIHGKSRYPGLFIWTRGGKKVRVSVPNGCLLVQAGKQLEHLTGGYVKAGYHEVVVTEDTIKAIEKSKILRRPLWRVSSTLFFHVQSDQVLEPFADFKKLVPNAEQDYPPILTGNHVSLELQSLQLKK